MNEPIRFSRCTGLLFGALLALAPVPMAAQAVVRQGTTEDLPFNVLKSPMLLELPFGDFAAMKDGGSKMYTDQAKYVCDDVILEKIKIKKKIKDGGQLIRLVITSDIYVRPSYDRAVDLRFTLLKGTSSTASTDLRQVPTKEQRTKEVDAQLELSADAFDRLFSGPDQPVLKVVLAVSANR